MLPLTFNLYEIVLPGLVNVVDPIATLPSAPRIANAGVDAHVEPPAAVDGVISNTSLASNWLPTLKFLKPEEPKNKIGAPEFPEASLIAILVETLAIPLTSSLYQAVGVLPIPISPVEISRNPSIAAVPIATPLREPDGLNSIYP